jgi:pimeloyl-ACP methyl ester carboxylesterase
MARGAELLAAFLALSGALCASPVCFAAETKTTKTDEPSLALLAQMTHLAYVSYCIDGIKAWDCFWCAQSGAPGVNVTLQFDNDSVWRAWGYVGTTTSLDLQQGGENGGQPKTVGVVSFRGSTTLDNWETDFDLLPTNYPEAPGALVHSGFLKSWNAVKEEVIAAVRKLGVTRVVVTGHSLGAALAQLAAVDLQREKFAATTLIDFGQPRVGNKAFADYAATLLAGRSWRTVNEADPVPHVPMEFLGFHHPPREVWFATNNSAHPVFCSGSNGEDPKCSDGLPDWKYALGVLDHLHYLGVGGPDGLHAGDAKGCPSQCIISGRC